MKIDPEEVIYSITMLDILRALERRIGKEESSTLSENDLSLAKEEVVAVIEHMNISVLDEALDAWEITRNL